MDFFCHALLFVFYLAHSSDSSLNLFFMLPSDKKGTMATREGLLSADIDLKDVRSDASLPSFVSGQTQTLWCFPSL